MAAIAKYGMTYSGNLVNNTVFSIFIQIFHYYVTKTKKPISKCSLRSKQVQWVKDTKQSMQGAISVFKYYSLQQKLYRNLPVLIAHYTDASIDTLSSGPTRSTLFSAKR